MTNEKNDGFKRMDDADPGQQAVVVVAVFKYTTEILWRKRDGTATLSRGEHL